MPIIVIAAIVFASGLLHLYLLDQVRVTLSRNHSELWRDLSSKTRPDISAIARFVRKREDRPLKDAQLTGITRAAAYSSYLSLAMMVVWGVVVFSQMHR